MLELNRLYHMDCLEGMKLFPDRFFDLAIVDPPYGGGGNNEWEGKKHSRFGGWFNDYHITAEDITAARTGGGRNLKYQKDVPEESVITHWDIPPPKEYFEELARISRNQIIWGGNYFDLPPTRCFLVWRKLSISENFTMAIAEYAWTSFNDNAKVFEHVPQGNKSEPRFHPTQKPVALYKWILKHFAEKGFKIIDTHAGSGSCLIACCDMGYDFIGFEIDRYYYEKAEKRLYENSLQMRMDI